MSNRSKDKRQRMEETLVGKAKETFSVVSGGGQSEPTSAAAAPTQEKTEAQPKEGTRGLPVPACPAPEEPESDTFCIDPPRPEALPQVKAPADPVAAEPVQPPPLPVTPTKKEWEAQEAQRNAQQAIKDAALKVEAKALLAEAQGYEVATLKQAAILRRFREEGLWRFIDDENGRPYLTWGDFLRGEFFGREANEGHTTDWARKQINFLRVVEIREKQTGKKYDPLDRSCRLKEAEARHLSKLLDYPEEFDRAWTEAEEAAKGRERTAADLVTPVKRQLAYIEHTEEAKDQGFRKLEYPQFKVWYDLLHDTQADDRIKKQDVLNAVRQDGGILAYCRTRRAIPPLAAMTWLEGEKFTELCNELKKLADELGADRADARADQVDAAEESRNKVKADQARKKRVERKAARLTMADVPGLDAKLQTAIKAENFDECIFLRDMIRAVKAKPQRNELEGDESEATQEDELEVRNGNEAEASTDATEVDTDRMPNDGEAASHSDELRKAIVHLQNAKSTPPSPEEDPEPLLKQIVTLADEMMATEPAKIGEAVDGN